MGTRLAGEVAIVTGSTHGIGRAIAVAFASEGADVLVTGRDDHAGAEVVERIAEVSGRGAFARGDLLDPDLGERLVASAREAFGRPTILVNNAASSDLVRTGADR